MSLSAAVLFSALLGQIVLTVILYMALIRVRFAAAKDRTKLNPAVAYDPAAWPPEARKIGNAVTSQFELPVLLYAGVLFAFQFGATGWLMAALAVLFVVLRVVHAVIHTGRNIVIQRFRVFAAGFATMLIFWAFLAAHAFGVVALAG